MIKNIISKPLSFAALILLGACGRGGDTPAGPAPAATPEETSPPAYARTPSTEGAHVVIVTPDDGDTVSSPFTVHFAATGMGVVRSGDDTPGTGHHHVLIDTGLPDMGLPIPADDRHIHFGDGCSSTDRTLPAGENTLQMLFGDYLHIPHDPPVYSEVITIIVE